MLRSLYGQFKRLLNWLNRSGYSVKDVENHRRDVESRYGGDGVARGGD